MMSDLKYLGKIKWTSFEVSVNGTLTYTAFQNQYQTLVNLRSVFELMPAEWRSEPIKLRPQDHQLVTDFGIPS